MIIYAMMTIYAMIVDRVPLRNNVWHQRERRRAQDRKKMSWTKELVGQKSWAKVGQKSWTRSEESVPFLLLSFSLSNPRLVEYQFILGWRGKIEVRTVTDRLRHPFSDTDPGSYISAHAALFPTYQKELSNS